MNRLLISILFLGFCSVEASSVNYEELSIERSKQIKNADRSLETHTYDTTLVLDPLVGVNNINVGIIEDLGGLLVKGINEVPSFILFPTDLKCYSNWFKAQSICLDLESGGFDDWRLPTAKELELIHRDFIANKAGNFNVGHYYWSSSEIDKDEAFVGFFYANFRILRGDKYNGSCCIRPVRSL